MQSIQSKHIAKKLTSSRLHSQPLTSHYLEKPCSLTPAPRPPPHPTIFRTLMASPVEPFMKPTPYINCIEAVRCNAVLKASSRHQCLHTKEFDRKIDAADDDDDDDDDHDCCISPTCCAVCIWRKRGHATNAGCAEPPNPELCLTIELPSSRGSSSLLRLLRRLALGASDFPASPSKEL